MATRKRPYVTQSDDDDDADDAPIVKRQTPTPEGMEEEVDPLDAFMAEVHEEVKSLEAMPKTVRLQASSRCDDSADPVADFIEARREKGMSSAMMAAMKTGTKYDSDDEVYAAAKAADQDLEAEYDSDDQLIITKKDVGLIPAIDHDVVDYDVFDKDFYEPCADVKNKTENEVKALRTNYGIKVGGFDVPTPVESFFQFGFDMSLLSVIKKQNFEKPTPIQMQTLPVALSGRDVVGLAKTGSGKTAAYLLPLCIHVMAASVLKKGEGPIALMLAPTRELSEQIHKQSRIFVKPYTISVAACFGGLRKYDQIKTLKAGCDVVVATPGRMIDLIKAKACTLHKTTFVVLDEADRMFDMGLEKQVRSIMGQIRPDRQTLLFSATMPQRVERLCRDVLTNPVRISIGRVGAINEDIKQTVEVVTSDAHKLTWLVQYLPSFIDAGEVLIFANQKQRVDEITDRIKEAGFRAAGIHGDMDQHTRMHVLSDFRKEVHHVLIATDVAARGLDIPSIKTVINFDCSKGADGHTHRVGRTGRAGDKEGTAFTLITPDQTRQAAFLANSLSTAGQEVSEALYEVAMQDERFARRGGKGRKAIGRRGAGRVGGSGLGFNVNTSADPVGSVSDFTPSHTKMESEWMSSMGAAPPKEAETPTVVHPPVVITAAKSVQPNVFGSSFVSSGVQGGDQKQKATIIAPKRATKANVPPPPVPVTERPLYQGRPRSSTPRRQPTAQPPQRPGNEFQKAFAVAQEIAARFGGSVAKGDDVDPSEPKRH